MTLAVASALRNAVRESECSKADWCLQYRVLQSFKSLSVQ